MVPAALRGLKAPVNHHIPLHDGSKRDGRLRSLPVILRSLCRRRRPCYPGPGASQQVGAVAKRLRISKVLVVSDAALDKAGLVKPVVELLEKVGCQVQAFTGGEPEPSLRVAEACLVQAKSFSPDGLVAVGGGSNMDLAKTLATVLAHGGSPRDYLGEERVPGPVLPLICLPTTAGTGSEVSGSCVLTDEENHLKVAIASNFLRPRAALVDPRLTLSCPRKVTADSGIDALTHAIEAYTAVDNEVFPLPPGEVSVYQGRHPLADCIAEKAIDLVGKNLVRAVQEPQNLQAREAMSLAALLGGLAFSNVGVALVHALEYPVGGATHCSHGEGNGLLLPYVMRYNLPAKVSRFARVAELLGENISGLSEQAAAERSIAAVERLNREIGIPTKLRELGVRADQLAGFAEKTMGIKRILRVNPRVPTMEDLVQILEAAL